MGALGLLALLICANFSLLYNHPRDMILPGRVKIKITISLSVYFQADGVEDWSYKLNIDVDANGKFDDPYDFLGSVSGL